MHGFFDDALQPAHPTNLDLDSVVAGDLCEIVSLWMGYKDPRSQNQAEVVYENLANEN